MSSFAFFSIFIAAVAFSCGWELNEMFHKKETRNVKCDWLLSKDKEC